MNQPMQLGRYSLHAQLAGGGMATVFLARLNGAVGFGRTVAIKRLHPHLARDPEFVTMFLDEARLSARIQHQNVVPTLDVVATDGELFLVLEYVKGETLSVVNRAMAKQRALIPVPIVTSLAVGMLNGLEAAHEARDERGVPLEIVHRDVSPQNVMVGADGVARILDFGIAKAASRLGSTREGQLKGKIAYMAPEQLMGVVSKQTDIYAAGVVLWEELTGRRLFYAETEVHTMGLVQKGDVQRPSALNPAVPPALDDIVMKALARQPENRFRSAHEMAAAIESVTEVASPNRVADWLRQVAGDLIDARARLVKEIESGVRTPGALQVMDALRAPGVLDSGPFHQASGSNPILDAYGPASSPPMSGPPMSGPPTSSPSNPSQRYPGAPASQSGPFFAASTAPASPPDPNFVPTQSASSVSLHPPGAAVARNRTIMLASAAVTMAALVTIGVVLGRGTSPANNPVASSPSSAASSRVAPPLPETMPVALGVSPSALPSAAPSPVPPGSSAPKGTAAVVPDPRKDPRLPPPAKPKPKNDLDNLLDSR